MTDLQRLKNLSVPAGKVDVVLDTDAYNEIDDQFAIAYLLRSKEKCNTIALYAAPFFNANSDSPKDGMEKSHAEILRILDLMGREDLKDVVYAGSVEYLKDEKTPVASAAAEDLVVRASCYSPERPLYVVAIGAITNVASALLMKPEIAEKVVVVWLGGHSRHMPDTKEFNMRQDYAAARVVMRSGAPFVQLPCGGTVDYFAISKPELQYWLEGKNPIADYLAKNTIQAADSYAKGQPWTRVIWDVTAVGWLLNDEQQYMHSEILPVVLPNDEGQYEETLQDTEMCYVDRIYRCPLMADLFEKLLR